MPKTTFFNLSEEKKKKITEAIKNEFSRNTFSKASISNIIEEAQIPRGSFYQYFEDKEDALKYIIEEFISLEKEEIKNSLIKNNGNIFETSLDIFEYVTSEEYNDSDKRLCQNIIQELKEENKNIFEGFKHRKVKQLKKENNDLINIDILNIKDENDLKYIMRILTITTRSEIADVINQRKDKELAKIELEKQIEILKRGMEK